MDVYKNLPAPARIAIPAVLLLIVAFMVYTTFLKAPPPVQVVKTQDIGVFDISKRALTSKLIPFEESQGNGSFMLTVAEKDATEAASTLKASGLEDRTGLAPKLSCPAAPGFTATKAANERADNCTNAAKVQGMLLTAGAIAANVSVSQEENGTLLGPEKSMNVVAQVFLPKRMKGNWNAGSAARAIAGAVGTSADRVTITDDELQSLFDGSQANGADGAAASASTLSLGCGDIAGATEVETKKAAVRSCYKSSIGDELTRLLGGSDRYVLTVEPMIDSVARMTTSTRQSKGPASSSSTQKGSGNSVVETTNPPSTSETTTQDPAGDVTQLRLSVTLDKNHVKDDQVLAVRRLLQTHIIPRRGDPTPLVTVVPFANGAGGKASSAEIEQVRKDATQGSSDEPVLGQTTQKLVTPTWMYALAAVLVIGLVTTIVLLWRRSAGMAAERTRLEESFQHDQRLLENFAQQNPDQLAQEMNALFGAPSAPERTYG